MELLVKPEMLTLLFYSSSSSVDLTRLSRPHSRPTTAQKKTRCNIIQYSSLLSILYMFQAVSLPIIRSSKTVHTASGICQACLLLPLAVAASKPGTYQMLCAQFLRSWWWAEKPP